MTSLQSQSATSSEKLRRNSVFSVTGFLAQNLLLLIATPLLLRRMGAADYGLWQVALAGLGLMGVFDLGLGTATSKYIAEHSARGDSEAQTASASLTLLAYLAVGLLLTPIVWIASPSLAAVFSSSGVSTSSVELVIRLIALGLPPLLLMNWGLGVAVGLERFHVPMVALIAQNVLTLTTAAVVVYLNGSVQSVVVSSLASLWLVAACSVAFGLVALGRFNPRGARASLDIREMFSFIGKTGLTSLGTLVFRSFDRITVGAVLGLRAVAYYTVSIAIANRFVSLADFLTRPLMPAASVSIATNQADVVLKRLVRWTRVVVLLCWPLAILALVSAGPVLRLWAGESFALHASSTFRVLIIIYALNAVAAPAWHSANGCGYPGVVATAALIGGFGTIFLITVLGPRYGLVGAALANGAALINLGIPVFMFLRLRQLRAGIPARLGAGAWIRQRRSALLWPAAVSASIAGGFALASGRTTLEAAALASVVCAAVAVRAWGARISLLAAALLTVQPGLLGEWKSYVSVAAFLLIFLALGREGRSAAYVVAPAAWMLAALSLAFLGVWATGGGHSYLPAGITVGAGAVCAQRAFLNPDLIFRAMRAATVLVAVEIVSYWVSFLLGFRYGPHQFALKGRVISYYAPATLAKPGAGWWHSLPRLTLFSGEPGLGAIVILLCLAVTLRMERGGRRVVLVTTLLSGIAFAQSTGAIFAVIAGVVSYLVVNTGRRLTLLPASTLALVFLPILEALTRSLIKLKLQNSPTSVIQRGVGTGSSYVGDINLSAMTVHHFYLAVPLILLLVYLAAASVRNALMFALVSAVAVIAWWAEPLQYHPGVWLILSALVVGDRQLAASQAKASATWAGGSTELSTSLA